MGVMAAYPPGLIRWTGFGLAWFTALPGSQGATRCKPNAGSTPLDVPPKRKFQRRNGFSQFSRLPLPSNAALKQCMPRSKSWQMATRYGDTIAAVGRIFSKYPNRRVLRKRLAIRAAGAKSPKKLLTIQIYVTGVRMTD
jgi:hypothetical protein